MARAKLTWFDIGSLAQLAGAADRLSPEQTALMAKRATGTLARRLPTDASRLVASRILHVGPRAARAQLSAKVTRVEGAEAVALSGLRRRIPLSDFQGVRYRGRGAAGVTVPIWRDTAPKTLPHTFTSRGLPKGVYQRTPGYKGDDDRLYPRLPLVFRKGPEMARAVVEREHGDLYPDLVKTGRDVLVSEIQRLTKG